MTPDEIRTAITRLEKAKLDLALGEKTVSVSYDGKSVSYMHTDIGKINGLIAELKAQLGGLRRSFPIQF
jgi:hypothetical protein